MLSAYFPPSPPMKFDQTFLETLAASYSHLVGRINTHLHLAIVYGRGDVPLAISTNRVGSRSRGAGYGNMTIHAERAALKAVGDVRLLEGATLVVIRIGKSGKLMGSAPCEECQSAIAAYERKYGLGTIVHS